MDKGKTQMTLETLAAIMNIIASLAVVATLGFLAFQISHNSRMMRMSAAQTGAELFTANLGRVIESADLAAILAREDYSDLSDADLLRLRNFLAASFRHHEVLHAHQRCGVYEEELWHGSEARLRTQLEDSDVREWWEGSRPFYAKSFADYVDGVIAELTSVNRRAVTRA